VPNRCTSPELIGRERELEELAEALERARAGVAGTAFVTGEAGVGKTRLVREFAERATGEGARVLIGECLALAEGELPFAPLVGALRPLIRELPPGELEAIHGHEELGRLLPELGDVREMRIAGGSALAETLAQSRLFEVMLGVLSHLGQEAPVVLVVEDLHWADRSTRDFISFLIRNARDALLLLVCTYRSDELHRRHPLRPFLAEEERRERVERVELAPLTRDEVGALAGAILGEPAGEALVDDLFRRSDGNPFYAEELLEASTTGRTIPATLRDTLIVRIEALSGPARGMLRLAAAAGQRVSHRLLSQVSELRGAELDDALRECVARNVLLQEGDSFAFRHALVREAVYSDLLPGERSKFHAALAEALTADPSLGESTGSAAVAELAYHWWEARRLPEALSAAVAAGVAAERAYAFAEAQRHLEHALEIWDDVEDAEERAGQDRAALLGRAAENANLSDYSPRSVALAREAVELIDAEAEPVRAALQRERLGRYLWVSGFVEESLHAYHQAVDLMPADPPSPELARVLAARGQILMLRGHPRESRELCRRAIEVARSVGARAEEGHALNTLGADTSMLGDRREGIECLTEAKRIAEELEWIDEIGRCYVNLSEEIAWDGRLSEAVDLALVGVEAMQRLGAGAYVRYLETETAGRLGWMGRLAEAERLTRNVRRSAPRGMNAAILGGVEAELALARGDLEAAEESLRQARDGLGATRDSMFFGPVAGLEVELAVVGGRPEEAVRRFEEALAEVAGEEYEFSVARLYARGTRAYADLAERARALGDGGALAAAKEGAARALERFEALLDPARYPEGSAVAMAFAYAAVARGEALRGEGRPDPEPFAEAAGRLDELSMTLEHIYAERREAEVLAGDGGDRERAAALIASAATAAESAGATGPLEEIRSLARRMRLPLPAAGEGVGAGSRPDGAVERFGLTGRELEVLALVADGRTNREIGEALFIAEKTASVHVSRILGKLEVRSRVEAATAAHRLGLARPREEAPEGSPTAARP
jgi:DNA-binding CsgD family transcriptional regulator/tetratricopeptide (TPR) repeat protein